MSQPNSNPNAQNFFTTPEQRSNPPQNPTQDPTIMTMTLQQENGQPILAYYYLPPLPGAPDPYRELDRGYMLFYKFACVGFTLLLLPPCFETLYYICTGGYSIFNRIIQLLVILIRLFGCVVSFLANKRRDAQRARIGLIALVVDRIVDLILTLYFLGLKGIPDYVIITGVVFGCLIYGAYRSLVIMEKVKGSLTSSENSSSTNLA